EGAGGPAMTDAPGPGPKPARPGRRRALALVGLAVIVVGGAAWWWLLRPRPPAPPDIPATIQDEDARAAVAAARNEVIGHLEAAARSDLSRKRATIYLAVAHRRLGHPDEAGRLEQAARSLPEENDWPDPYMDDFHVYTRGPEAVHAEAKKLLDQGRTAEAVQ